MSLDYQMAPTSQVVSALCCSEMTLEKWWIGLWRVVVSVLVNLGTLLGLRALDYLVSG